MTMPCNVAIVKTEPVEAIDIEKRIIDLCEKNPVGISTELLQAAIPTSDAQQIIVALNRLVSQDKLDILKQGKEEKLLFKLKDPDTAKKCRGADNEEKIVYKIIKEAGNKGIWSKDLRIRSNLSLTPLNKILKTLESKRLIKAVNSVNASKKKVYMLADIEPHCSVTGGAWYSEQEFESEFIDVLNQQCYRFLQQAKISKDKLSDPISQRNASFRSSKDIWKHINELKVSKVELSKEDIESILDTLIYDGKVEKTVILSNSGSSASDDELEKLYRVVDPVIFSTGLMRMPCGVCMVFNDCHEGGVVSPSTCQYMKEWLEF